MDKNDMKRKINEIKMDRADDTRIHRNMEILEKNSHVLREKLNYRITLGIILGIIAQATALSALSVYELGVVAIISMGACLYQTVQIFIDKNHYDKTMCLLGFAESVKDLEKEEDEVIKNYRKLIDYKDGKKLSSTEAKDIVKSYKYSEEFYPDEVLPDIIEAVENNSDNEKIDIASLIEKQTNIETLNALKNELTKDSLEEKNNILIKK